MALTDYLKKSSSGKFVRWVLVLSSLSNRDCYCVHVGTRSFRFSSFDSQIYSRISGPGKAGLDPFYLSSLFILA